MADMEQAGLMGGIVAGVVMALKEIGSAIVKAIRRKGDQEEDARASERIANIEHKGVDYTDETPATGVLTSCQPHMQVAGFPSVTIPTARVSY